MSRCTSRPLWKFHPDIRMETEKQDDEPESPINRNDFAEPLVYSITNSMWSDISSCLSGAPPCVDSKQQMGMNMSSGYLTLIAALLSWLSLSVCILTKTHKNKKRKKKENSILSHFEITYCLFLRYKYFITMYLTLFNEIQSVKM